MQVNVGKEGSVVVVRPVGPIVRGELDELEYELERLTRHWSRRVVLDLGDTPLIDSAGLELLCRTHRAFAEHGLQLKLSGLGETMATIFELTRVGRRFQLFTDSSTAVRSFL